MHEKGSSESWNVSWCRYYYSICHRSRMCNAMTPSPVCCWFSRCNWALCLHQSVVAFFNANGHYIKDLSPVLPSVKKWQHQTPLIKQKRNGRWFSPPNSFGSFARKERSKFLNFFFFFLIFLSCIRSYWGTGDLKILGVNWSAWYFKMVSFCGFITVCHP